jgi:hypothetical protein
VVVSNQPYRAASGDAGIGLTVRRMRDQFLGRMTVAYYLQPLAWCNGSIFKRYPGLWRLYLEARGGDGGEGGGGIWTQID